MWSCMIMEWIWSVLLFVNIYSYLEGHLVDFLLGTSSPWRDEIVGRRFIICQSMLLLRISSLICRFTLLLRAYTPLSVNWRCFSNIGRWTLSSCGSVHEIEFGRCWHYHLTLVDMLRTCRHVTPLQTRYALANRHVTPLQIDMLRPCKSTCYALANRHVTPLQIDMLRPCKSTCYALANRHVTPLQTMLDMLRVVSIYGLWTRRAACNDTFFCLS